MAVGRFQIMSLLQAARAYVLGLPLESAQSWGLNRATFIAAAKRGFKSGGGSEGREAGKGGGKNSKRSDVYFLGDDMAYKTERDGVMLFTFGGKVQTKEEFDKRVRVRFGSVYPQAWKEALALVKKFDKETLNSAEAFFHDVYKPVRDEWAEAWTEASEPKDTNDK